jgi:HD-GYP domain-containing protein (c-di-GMP phosphodiesterase class II)
MDGGGYPDSLVGDEIPLGARIIAVCDAFGAMTSDRPYRRAVSADSAVAELLRHAGTQFDAEVIAEFQAELADPSHERPAIPYTAGFDARALSASAS